MTFAVRTLSFPCCGVRVCRDRRAMAKIGLPSDEPAPQIAV